MSSEPDQDSLGIADAIIQNFFPSLQQASNRENAISFFGDDASLYFQGTTVTGKQNIYQFLSSLPDLTFNITGYEVQTVPQSDLWSMLIVFGTMQNEHVQTFHSSVYVEARKSDQTAFIRYFSLTSFD